jgi:hypothetical protein
MRIFRQGAGMSGPEYTGFGIERAVRAWGKSGPAFGFVLEDSDSIGTLMSGPEVSQQADVRPCKNNLIGSGATAFLPPVLPFPQCARGQLPEEIAP